MKLVEVPTDDLITELMNRCEPAIFIGYKNEGTLSGVNTFFNYKGHPSVCYGLCHQLSFEMLKAEVGVKNE